MTDIVKGLREFCEQRITKQQRETEELKRKQKENEVLLYKV